jgi:hypothetical protein
MLMMKLYKTKKSFLPVLNKEMKFRNYYWEYRN